VAIAHPKRLLVGPEGTRLARPTSITIESESSRTRVTLQSQASLCTLCEEIGSECSS